MDLDFVQAIRMYELEQIRALFPPGSTVLEIGAGAGWQAKVLAEGGCEVSAIDIAGSRYSDKQIWPVQEYDGQHIPFPPATFDLVFSSNVLEHIPHLVPFQNEIKRVLKPQGKALHILPTTWWRLWTLLTHYPALVKWLYLLVARKLPVSSPDPVQQSMAARLGKYTWSQLVCRALWPPRHGERGNALSELSWFSRTYWQVFFAMTGWRLVQVYPAGLFYSGNLLFGPALGIPWRRQLSRVLGSATMIYVIEPGDLGI
jgi:SAM-dependent methyltransferase